MMKGGTLVFLNWLERSGGGLLLGLTVGLEAVQVTPAEGHVEQRVRPGEGHAAVVQLCLHALPGPECPSLPVSHSYNTQR